MSYKEDILQLRAEGKSYGEISEILGCSKGTVAYYLKDKPENNKEKESVVVSNSEYSNKVITYIDNYKVKRPCISCGQFLHQSQLDPLDIDNVNIIVSTVVDKETFEESKRKISQLKFICANCDRLRKFKEDNKGK